jgi:hypothetical protein
VRRLQVLALIAVSMVWLPPAKVEAGSCGWHAGSCGIAAIHPIYRTGPTYTLCANCYYTPNLYYYRSYYPYPAPPNARRPVEWRGSSIIVKRRRDSVN